VLGEIQPENGGFLEATPLTSFVVMSLAGSGQIQHPVTTNGARFLEASQRGDGCWPIDTNLATWLTTLSVNAITRAIGGGTEVDLDGDWRRLTKWLLRQQYRRVHPYTNAPPGGWAWTDLPGGVPDADDTAGALVAMRALREAGGRGSEWEGDMELRESVRSGASWLMDLQNRDGGIPTFCRGWGALPFDRSAPDLTAHALRAWLAWYGELPVSDRLKTGRAIHRALEYLRKSQRADGSWLPLWFGNQHTPDETNPVYGTSRVLRALAEARRQKQTMNVVAAGLPREMIDRGTDWLVRAQRPDGGWSGAGEGEGPASVEETALAVAALAGMLACEGEGSRRDPWREAAVRGTEWLIERVENGLWEKPAPIGFYFARLWYFEALYPLIFTVEALGGMRAMLMDNAGG
jgi:squalene-hopene/tetraprenyl-beta-curcumene cyclase